MKKKKLFSKIVLCWLSVFAVLSSFGNLLPRIREPQATLTGSWYKMQMDTHTGYSAFMNTALPASLYNTVKAWSDAGFDIVVVKDYYNLVLESGNRVYTSSDSFDSATGWYNYSVTGSPSEGTAEFDSDAPSAGSTAGSGHLHVNGIGRAMVSYWHDTYSPQSGRHTLDLHRSQLIKEWGSFTDSFSGNVALGVEVRFTSGRKLVLYESAGTDTYSNSSDTVYYDGLVGWFNKHPFTHLKEWLKYNFGYTESTIPYFNVTKAYLNTWNQSAYLADKLLEFRWFVEAFDTNSWVDVYVDRFYWEASSNWDAYAADIALAETDHNIICVAGFEISEGVPYNQLNSFNVNASGIAYNGTIESYLRLPDQVTARGGLSFIEELYESPNGTSYAKETEKDAKDWLGRGYNGFTQPFPSYWDTYKLEPWTTIYNWGGNESLWYWVGADLHGNYTDKIPLSGYSLVYVEGTLTEQKVIDAVTQGHFQNIRWTNYPNTVTWTNISIAEFDINKEWMMGDWATPNSGSTLNIQVDADVQINNVTLVWNGQPLRTWSPNQNTFSTTVDASVGGWLRLYAFDQNDDWKVWSQPIFIKPTSPYVQETTHPENMSARFLSNTNTLTLSISGSGTSTTRVYCGTRGKPREVTGASSWSYNSETRILTVDILHTSLEEVVIYFAEHTAPETTISLSGVLGNNDWFISEVTVTLFPTDDISGVHKTEYSFDDITWIIYTGPFTVTREGNIVTYYKSTDRVGNVETAKTELVKIDKTPPSASMTINATKPTANSVQNQVVHVDEAVAFNAVGSTDNIGIVSFEWDFGEGESGTGVTVSHIYSSPGEYTAALTVRDAAGNSDMDSLVVTVIIPTEDEGKFGEGLPLQMLTVVAAIGVVIATFFLTRKRSAKNQN